MSDYSPGDVVMLNIDIPKYQLNKGTRGEVQFVNEDNSVLEVSFGCGSEGTVNITLNPFQVVSSDCYECRECEFNKNNWERD